MANKWVKNGTVIDFIYLSSKITADGDCSHEIKWHLLLGRKAVTNLDRILKSRTITLPTKVHLVRPMVFPVVIYGCESWTIKKAEHRRIDAFELWCWRRLLRVPWTARKSNLSILKENSLEYSLEGLILRLKLQYFGYLMGRTNSLGKTLMLGKIEGMRRRGWQRMRWLDASPTRWTWVWVDSDSWWWTGRPGVLQSMGSQRVAHNWATELNEWKDYPNYFGEGIGISTIVFLDGSHSVYGICFSLNKAVSLYCGSLLNSAQRQEPSLWLSQGLAWDLEHDHPLLLHFLSCSTQTISPEAEKLHQREGIWSGPWRRALAML